MQRSHLALGAEGEARAARFLARRGYRILARNVRAGGVEIDLVATRGALLAFVEVKTRRTRDFGAPDHKLYYSKDTLARMLKKHGFARTRFQPSFGKGLKVFATR